LIELDENFKLANGLMLKIQLTNGLRRKSWT